METSEVSFTNEPILRAGSLKWTMGLGSWLGSDWEPNCLLFFLLKPQVIRQDVWWGRDKIVWESIAT